MSDLSKTQVAWQLTYAIADLIEAVVAEGEVPWADDGFDRLMVNVHDLLKEGLR